MPGAAGWPHRLAGLSPFAAQLPGKLRAVAMDAGIASQAVGMICASALKRVLSDGSAIQYIPGAAGAIVSA